MVLVVWIFVMLSFINDNKYYLIGVAIFYIVQLFESFLSKTDLFLSNVQPIELTEAIIEDLKAEPPKIEFEIQNYHYETRLKHGKKKLETKKVKFNTHYAR